MNNYNAYLQNLIFTKKKLSDVSDKERRELYQLYTIRYGSVIFDDTLLGDLLINMFSDYPTYKSDNKIVDNFKNQISTAVDNDLVRYFDIKSDIKSSSNDKPF